MGGYCLALVIWLNVMVGVVENFCYNCDNCRQNWCSKCSDGYYVLNGYCNRCPSICTTCTSWYDCNSCEEGYYLGNGNCFKCPSTCTTCTSWYDCNSCEKGYHGSSCGSRCDTNCIHTTCYQDGGSCVDGCSVGFYQSGSSCVRCSDYIPNCEECTDRNRCTRCASGYHVTYSGRNIYCTECPSGNWGDQCQQVCSTSCANTVCRPSDGKCTLCTRYTYDKTCQSRCSEGCKNGTGTNVCARWTGKCLYGCKPGYSGVNCDSVDGKWGEWSDFGHCSVTCGQGSWTRTRKCDQPSPQYGGQECEGNRTETKGCNKDNCPVDGGWGQWSAFTSCSVTCGEGNKTRTRSCDQPEPKNNGLECVGENYDIMICGEVNCSSSSGQTGASGAVVGGVAGSVVLLLIVGFALAFILIFRRRKQRQTSKDCNQVVYVNNSTETATTHGFENNSYNTDLNQHGSRNEVDDLRENMAENYVYAQVDKPRKDKIKDSVTTQNEENVYSVPLKDKTKTSLGRTGREVKGKGPAEEFNIPPVPRKLPYYMEDDDLEEISESNISEIDTADGKIPEQSDTYYNTNGLIRRRIPVEKLANTVAEKSADEFLKEFKRLTDGLSRDYTAALKPENRYRNRYKQIFPYDVTRVKLTGVSSDYINASHIDGYQQSQNYIACLGPTISTTDNFTLFWTMVWQQNVGRIVMLTRIMEGEKIKCEQYWPEADSETYGDITVHRISEANYAEFSIRNLDVVKGCERRRVCHIHYLAWPDRGVPHDVTTLLEFRHKVVGLPTSLNGPTIIHCSAGIGRTGTYIALDMLIQEGLEEKYVDVYSCVNGIRGQRVNLVQNVDQYKFLHYALVHELTLPSEMLSSAHMTWSVTEDGRNELRRQFKQLQAVIQRTPDTETESVRRNRGFKTKNRKEADVPGDRHRVKLDSKKPGGGDYINATFINGYIKEKQFIVAQTPLPETLVDFVGLIMQENIACIVSMDPDIPHEKTTGIYPPPANQKLKVGTYTLSCTNSISFANYVLRTLELSNLKGSGGEKKTVYHFQPTLWENNEAVPTDAADFVRMVTEVEKTSTNIRENLGGTLLHCLNAVERSGLFCVVALLIQKLNYEQNISVLNTVRQLRSIRHFVIPSEEQYIFCHECVVAYQASVDDTYTNVNWRA